MRIQLSTLALLAGATGTLPAQAPPGLAGTVVVANKQDATASFVDVASATIVATVPTGDGPHELVVSADGRTAIVTNYGARAGGSTLTVLDVAGTRVARTLDLGRHTRPHGILFLPGDSIAAVTSEATQAVVLVRVSDGEVVGVLHTGARGSHMAALTEDGSRLFTGNIGEGTVSEFDVRSLSTVRVFRSAPQPEAIAVTAAGDRVFVGSNAEGTVSEIRTDDGRRRQIADGFGWPYRILLTPGARQLLVGDLRSDALRFIDGATYAELGRLPLPGAGPQGLTLHPDGRHLFLSLSREGRIAVIDVLVRQVVGYLPAGNGPDGVGYSPLVVAR